LVDFFIILSINSLIDFFQIKKARCEQRALKLLVSFIGYKMACYTALIEELRQDQSYILIVIMHAKLYKNFI